MIKTLHLRVCAVWMIAFWLNTIHAFGQSPGGVTGFAAWYKGDAGLSATAWNDQSANAYNLTGANSPVITNFINFNPVATFNGSNQNYSSVATAKANWPIGNSAFTYYYVARQTDNSNSNARSAIGIGADGTGFHSGRELSQFNIASGLNPYNLVTNGVRVSTTSPTWQTNPLNLIRSGHNAVNPSPFYISANGGTEATGVNVSSTYANTSVFRVGVAGTSTYEWQGDVAEVLVYPGKHAATDYNKVESYLAIKYGITKTGDYVASGGTTIWNASANSAYLNNIAGIASDNTSGLHQKQSQSQNAGRQLLIGAGGALANTNALNTNALTNGQFLVWGDNGLSKMPTQAISGLSGINYRLPAIWKVQNTGNVGTVRVMWPSGLNNLQLIKSSDAVFDGTDTLVNMSSNTQTINGVTYNYADVTIYDGQFITLGAYVNAPGGVVASLWFRSDKNVTPATGSVTSWRDYSYSGTTLVSALSSSNSSPTAVDGIGLNFNYNPAITFAQANALGRDTTLNALTSTNFSIFTTSTAATSGRILGMNRVDVGTGGFKFDFPGIEQNNDIYRNTTAGSQISPMSPLYNSFTNTTIARNTYTPTSAQRATNGSTLGTAFNYTNVPIPDGGFLIGRNANAGGDDNGFIGTVSEVIIIDKSLTANEINRVNSYLAIRNGITLDTTNMPNYLSSNSTVIWDGTANAGYKRNIAGIGKDDLSGLDQRQSASINTGQQLLIGAGGTLANTNILNANNTLTDGQFLIWGDNGGVKAPTTNLWGVAGVDTRFGAIWKTQNTNNVGTVRVMWPAIYTGLQLVRSTDANITSGDTFTPMSGTQTINGVSYNYADVSFNDTVGYFFTFACQQAFPGGVDPQTTENFVWYKADAITGVTENSSITSWVNSGVKVNYNLTEVAGTRARPLYYGTTAAQLVNFNPTLTFRDNHAIRNSSVLAPSNSPFSFFGVAVDSATSNGFEAILSASANFHDFNIAKNSNRFVNYRAVNYWFTEGANNQNTAGGNVFSPSGGSNAYYTGSAWVNNTAPTQRIQPQVFAMNSLNSTNASPLTSFVDGFKTINTSMAGTQSTFLNAFSVGSYAGGDFPFTGRIPEVMMYGRQLTDDESQYVNTYLAIKYGTTLGQGSSAVGNINRNINNYDYKLIGKEGAIVTIWNATSNSSYGYNIAGIGRNDKSALHQKQSRSVNANTQVLIATTGVTSTNTANGTSLNDGQYLVWGDNGLARTLAKPIARIDGVNYTMSAVWRIQNTDSVGTVRVMWPVGLSNIKLIVSSDPTFTFEDAVYDMSVNTQTINGTNFNYADVTLPNGYYFTFAGYACAPGGVIADLKAWYSAGSLSQANNSSVTGLSDLTGNGFNLVKHTALSGLNDPKYLTNDMNFNPTVKFDGEGDAFFYNSRFYPSTGSGTEFFGASSNATNDAKILSDIGLYDPYVGHNEFGQGRLYHDPGQSFPFTENTNVTLQNSIPFVGAYGWTYSALGSGDPDGRSLVSMNGNTVTQTQQAFFNIGFDYGGRMTLGALGDNGAYWWNGNISEAIYYDRDLTDAERNKVNSYLAVKYGVTLRQPMNYISSLDSIVWNASLNPTFNNNIFGIARDFSSCFTQNVSRSVNTNAIATLSTTNNFSAANTDPSRIPMFFDQQYLMIGDNAIDTGVIQVDTATCPLLVAGMKQLRKTWFVQRTADTSAKFLQIDLSSYPLNSDIRLMVTSDANFTSNVALIPAISFSGGKAVFYTAFPKNAYFTVVGREVAPSCTVCEGGTQTLQMGKIWFDQRPNAQPTNTVTNAPLIGTSPSSGQLFANVKIFDPNNVEFLPQFYPLWAGDRVLWVRYDNKPGNSGKTTYSIKLKDANGSVSAKANFQVSSNTEWVRTMSTVTVLGYCGGEVVKPKLTHAYNSNIPLLNSLLRSFSINDATSTMQAFKHGGALTPWSSVNVQFEKAVDSITIDWSRSNYYPFKVLSYMYISDIKFVCNNIVEPVPDNVNVIASYITDSLATCQDATMKIDFINNNCASKTINIQNTLPAALNYVADSYTGFGTETPTYGGQSFTMNNLVLPPGNSTAYIKVKPTNTNASGTYGTQFTYTVQGGLNVPNPYLSDNNSGQQGYQQTAITYSASTAPKLPAFNATVANTVEGDTTYVHTNSGAGDTLVYTYTFTNSSGSPISNFDLIDQISDSAYYVAGSIVASSGVTFSANSYGGVDNEKLLNLRGLTIPTGVSTVKVKAIARSSIDTIRSLATISNSGDNECALSVEPITDSTTVTPACFRNGLLVPLNTNYPVTLPDNCFKNQWLYYIDSQRRAVIAIRPNGSTWTPDYITINTQPFVNRKTDGLDSSVILQRLYTIKHSAALQNPVDVRLYYSQAEIDSQVPFAKYPMQGWFKHSGVKGDVEADLTPKYLLSTNAIVLSPSETGTEFGLQYVQFNGIATFSTIGYTGNTSESILPVELVSFTAYRKATTAVLDWYTASEVNNAGFEVQHSLDGVNFTPIGWVAGNGNSSVPHSYQFVHENLTEGVHYYRLKQVDFNGASELSKIISLSYETSGVVRVYPVPAKSEVYIQNGESYVSMRLMDASGRVVKSTMLNRQNLQKVDVSNLAQGAYMIVLEKADGSMETLKIMIQ